MYKAKIISDSQHKNHVYYEDLLYVLNYVLYNRKLQGFRL